MISKIIIFLCAIIPTFYCHAGTITLGSGGAIGLNGAGTIATQPYSFLGRWFQANGGWQSGWYSSQIRFKVSGSSTFTINTYVLDPSGTAISALAVNVDGGDYDLYYNTTAEEIYTGAKTQTIDLGDTNEHTIIIKLINFPSLMWNVSAYKLIFNGITLGDPAGTISAWPQTGPVRIGCIGDSWMGAQNDWPFLMNSAIFSIYPLGYGGATAEVLDDIIDYDYSGQVNSDDPVLDAVVINSSVNDYNASVTLANFETYFASLVDKVRAQQPTALIFLLQSPDNTGAGKIYSQYGEKMSTIASTRDGVHYIPISGIGALTWSDESHLDFSSRQTLATFVSNFIDDYF